MLAKAPTRGADVVIIDLEDGVALGDKEQARATAREHLMTTAGTQRYWVRVNADQLEQDVTAVLGAPSARAVEGIVLAKADVPSAQQLDAVLDRAEELAGLPPSSIPVVALVESATAVLQLEEIARAPRVQRVAMGEADLAAELDLRPSADGRELDPIRLRVVVASAAGGLGSPLGPVSTDFQDAAAFEASTRHLYRLGFHARQLIHPTQVEVVHLVVTPTADEVERARRVVREFEASDTGVVTDEQGRMVDRAVVRSAQRTLDRAEPVDHGDGSHVARGAPRPLM